MGGTQAAKVLAQIETSSLKAKGETVDEVKEKELRRKWISRKRTKRKKKKNKKNNEEE